MLGNRQTTTLPNGQEVAWLRYGSGHVHAMSLDRQPLFDFERVALHRETARYYGVQQQMRQYDVMGRLPRQQRLLGDEAQQQRLYHYTQTSELYGIDDSLKGETRYQYDPIGRLKAASTPLGEESFAFDPAGNLIDPELLQNTEPKLTVFSWDANLLTREEVFEGEFHFWDTFAYPKEPELEPEDPTKKFSLPLAQRVHTLTVRALKRTHWLYEPESFVPAAQLVETYDQRAQRMTGTSSIAYSSSVSTSIATVEPQLYYIHTDHLGTPQELTDSDGHLQWVGLYRAWGELAKANDSEGNASNVEMPLRFQGQYFDAETGLHYNRFRYYDRR